MTRILVIDDHKEVRAMICMVLRINHFEVDEAESAGASLKVFEGAAFDVAIERSCDMLPSSWVMLACCSSTAAADE